MKWEIELDEPKKNEQDAAKHRDIFRPFHLHQLSYSYFWEGGIGSKE